eukprot:757677-Hanusia_phi.AAC.3
MQHDTSAMSGNEGSFDYDNMKFINAELAWAKGSYSSSVSSLSDEEVGRAVQRAPRVVRDRRDRAVGGGERRDHQRAAGDLHGERRPCSGKPTPVEAALHALDANFFMIDPHCEDGRHFLVFASDGFLEATGYTREEIIGELAAAPPLQPSPFLARPSITC